MGWAGAGGKCGVQVGLLWAPAQILILDENDLKLLKTNIFFTLPGFADICYFTLVSEICN